MVEISGGKTRSRGELAVRHADLVHEGLDRRAEPVFTEPPPASHLDLLAQFGNI
jgi:hypothetical protein